MTSHILALSTSTPDFHLSQEALAERMIELFALKGIGAAKMRKLYQNSKIEKRYSAISDLGVISEKNSHWKPNFLTVPPQSSQINALFKVEAPKLAIKAAKKCLESSSIPPSSITHVISVSCTGMFAPGIEYSLMDALGLKRSVGRYGINFMGCFGAFKGLALADALAKENPSNKVLVVCTELCSLHLQPELTMEAFISNALFGDGSAAVIVGQPDNDLPSLWEIYKKGSIGLDDSLDKMSWDMGNHGFVMKLSKEVPELFRLHAKNFVETLIDNRPIFNQIDWAIHPGGRAIVEKLEQVLSLTSDQTDASWKTLKSYGNMSSATFLFVLEEVLKRGKKHPWCVGLGMGPGLSLEGIVLKNNAYSFQT